MSTTPSPGRSNGSPNRSPVMTRANLEALVNNYIKATKNLKKNYLKKYGGRNFAKYLAELNKATMEWKKHYVAIKKVLPKRNNVINNWDNATWKIGAGLHQRPVRK